MEHHPNLNLKVAHGFEIGHAKGLCSTHVHIFYANLTKAYNYNNYQLNQIWNYGESGAQVGQNGKVFILTHKVQNLYIQSIQLNNNG
jgi:hypothetical protein